MDNEKLNQMADSLKSNQISFVKRSVAATFEEIEKLEKERNALQLRLKILKHDLFDLKDGRLDRILERQEMSIAASEPVVSVVKVSRAAAAGGGSSNPWYIPYNVSLLSDSGGEKNQEEGMSLNNSIAKLHAPGAYKLKDGSVKYL